jgi:hypothetical protein
MQVKAQGLLNATKWIEDEYGRDALGDVIRACSPAVRERYMSAIAINWHPMEELVELVERADTILGRGDGKIAEALGAAGARANTKGPMLRMLFYLTKPEFLVRRVAGLWRQFNDQGEMTLLRVDERGLELELTGVDTPHRLFCAMLTGWARELVAATGTADVVARHTQCIARGQARCLWLVQHSGAGVDDGDKRTKGASDSVRPPSVRPSVSSMPAVRLSSKRFPAAEPEAPPSSGRVPKGDRPK